MYMADNFLEYARESYEKKKAEWFRKKRHLPKNSITREINKPDDEAL